MNASKPTPDQIRLRLLAAVIAVLKLDGVLG